MHYYIHNIGDHSKRAFHLTNEEDLAFRRLKDMYFDTELPIPKNIEQVARRIRVETHWVSNVLKDFFFEREDGWHIDEIDAEIERFRKNAVKNAENGRKGGRPPSNKKPTGFPLGCESNPNGNPNQQPTTNNQQPIEDKEKLKKEKAEKPRNTAPQCPADVSPEIWREWNLHRKKKRAQITDRVVSDFRKEAESVGMGLEEAIKHSMAKDWRGFEAAWVLNSRGMPQKATKQPHSTLEYVTAMG